MQKLLKVTYFCYLWERKRRWWSWWRLWRGREKNICLGNNISTMYLVSFIIQQEDYYSCNKHEHNINKKTSCVCFFCRLFVCNTFCNCNFYYIFLLFSGLSQVYLFHCTPTTFSILVHFSDKKEHFHALKCFS